MLKRKITALVLSASILLGSIPLDALASANTDLEDSVGNLPDIAISQDSIDSYLESLINDPIKTSSGNVTLGDFINAANEKTTDVTSDSLSGENEDVNSSGSDYFNDRTSVKAEDFPIVMSNAVTKDYEYYIDDNTSTVTITKYTGDGGEVIIPDTIDGMNVIEIGSGAFSGCSTLTSVRFGSVLKSIGGFAFEGCVNLESITFDENSTLKLIDSVVFRNCISLKDVDIPDSLVTLGGEAFSGCKNLASVKIGKSLTSIGYSAFNGCTVLEEVIFSVEGSLKTVEDYAFFGCNSLTSIQIPDTIITLGANAFAECRNLDTVSFNETANLKTIGSEAFNKCGNLESLVIPDSVTSIDYHAFYECDLLKSISFGSGLSFIGNGAFYGCKSLETVDFGASSNLKTIENGAFSGCINLEEIELPDSLTKLGGDYSGGVFENCTSLKTVTIGTKVTQIFRSTFSGCTNLETVTFKNNGALKTIGDNAFYSCKNLINIIIPKSVTSIGSEAFRDCSNLLKIEFGASLTDIGSGAFNNCVNLEKVTFDINSSLKSIGAGAFSNCKNLETIELPDSLTTLGADVYGYSGVFENCTNLTTVVFGKKLSNIGDYTFSNCKSLETVNLNNNSSLKEIGNYSFRDCKSLRAITIPGSVTSIGESAFSDCASLTTIVIPDSVITMGNNAFYNCTGIINLTLGAKVNSISESTFYNCISLKNLRLGSAVKEIGSYAFYNCLSLQNISIPNSTVTIGDNAFNGCKGASSIVIGNGVQAIGNSAFAGNEDLEHLEIGGSVVAIGSDAFRYNSKLTSVTIPSSTQSIDSRAFADCESLVSATIPENVWIFGTDVFSNVSDDFTILGMKGSPAETYAIDNDIMFVAIGNVITLNANDVTNSAEIAVSGTAAVGNTVKIYDGNDYLGEFIAGITGRYNGKVILKNPVDNSVHVLKAESMSTDGDIIFATKTITYSALAPKLTEFVLFHNNTTINLISDTGVRPILIFLPGSPFTFEIAMENNAVIDKLYVCSKRGGEEKYLEAIYDSGKKKYIASGLFDPDNPNYVPGTLSVKFSRIFEDSILDLDNPIDLDYYSEQLTDEWKNASVVEDEIENGQKYTVTLDDAEKSVVEATVTTTDIPSKSHQQLVNEGYSAVKTTSGETAYLKSFYDGIDYVQEYISVGKNGLKVVNTSIKLYQAFDDTFPSIPVFKNASTVLSVAGYTFDVLKVSTAINTSNLSRSEKDELNKRLAALVATKIAADTLIGLATKTSIGAGPAGVAIILGGLLAKHLISDIYKKNLKAILEECGVTDGNSIQMAIDPSGYIYEAVASNRLEGVKVTAYTKHSEDDSPGVWNAEEFLQINPLLTDKEGRYAWDVPEGLWQVKAELLGYETAYSEWLPVPPPQTSVNIGMVSKAVPVVERISGYEDYIEVVFSKYMDSSTFSADTITLSKDGNTIESEIEFVNLEADPADGGRKYVSIIHIKPLEDKFVNSDAISVKISGDIKSYAAVSIANDYTKSVDITIQPKALKHNTKLNVLYGNTKTFTVEILPLEAGINTKVFAVSSMPQIAEITDYAVTDDNGLATFTVTGNLPGEAEFTFIPEDSALETKIKANVALPGSVLIKGDVNGDLDVNTQDVVSLLRYSVGISTTFYIDNAYINDDDIIDNRDATFLLRALAGCRVENERIFDGSF